MLLANDCRLKGVATLPISSLTPVRKKVAPLVPTTLTAPFAPMKIARSPTRPLDRRKVAPSQDRKTTSNAAALPLITHVPAVSPGMVTTIFVQVFAAGSEKVNG